jgi:pimeloyl-ACP methyl ester carboxylesterase
MTFAVREGPEPPGRVLFLPGASGDGRFWRPVADRLPPCEKILLDWPGLGHVPPRPEIRGFDDLVTLTLGYMDRPVDLVAQSMGGVVALMAVLTRPEAVGRLVLTATSGGVRLSGPSLQDWRDEYRLEYPNAAPWVTEHTEHRFDLTDRIASIRCPTLLIWSDADPISPLAVGEDLARRLPEAELVVIERAEHMFARDRALEVAPHIARHLFGAR